MLTTHQIGGSADALKFAAARRTRFVIVVDDFGPANEFRANDPNIIVVGRKTDFFDVAEAMRRDNNPVAIADWWFSQQLPTYLANPQIRVWKGPNEPVFGSADDPMNQVAFHRYAQFEAERLRLLDLHRLRGTVGGFSYGTPDLPLWRHFGPALAAARQYRGWLTVNEYQNPHGYWDPNHPGQMPGSENDWGWMFLRIKQVYTEHLNPMGYGDIRTMIGEAGTIHPWRALRRKSDGKPLSIEEYADFLARYGSELYRAPQVDGAAVFTFGRDWNGFGVEGTGLANLLIDRLPPFRLPPVPGSEPIVGRMVKVLKPVWVRGRPIVVGSRVIMNPIKKTAVYAGTIFPRVEEQVGPWIKVTSDGWIISYGEYVMPL